MPAGITQLSVLIGTSQLLGLPLLAYLVVKRQYALVPFGFVAVNAMHFVLYSWLYQTPVYIATAVFHGHRTHHGDAHRARGTAVFGPARVCLLTGGALPSTAAVFIGIHLA